MTEQRPSRALTRQKGRQRPTARRQWTHSRSANCWPLAPNSVPFFPKPLKGAHATVSAIGQRRSPALFVRLFLTGRIVGRDTHAILPMAGFEAQPVTPKPSSPGCGGRLPPRTTITSWACSPTRRVRRSAPLCHTGCAIAAPSRRRRRRRDGDRRVGDTPSTSSASSGSARGVGRARAARPPLRPRIFETAPFGSR